MGRQQRLDGGAQLRLAGAGLFQKGGALGGRFGQRFVEQGFFAHGGPPASTAVFHYIYATERRPRHQEFQISLAALLDGRKDAGYFGHWRRLKV